MKRHIFFFFIFLSSLSYSQTYNNSWIPFSSSQPYSGQQYYKIQIVKEGIYRIDKSILLNANIPIKTPSIPNAIVDHSNLQLFVNGQEQPLYIDTTNDANGTYINYIQFYGKGNDGSLDSKLYIDNSDKKDSTKQANPYYSLFTDTATYFLTWNTSNNNKRFSLEKDTLYIAYTPSPYFIRPIIDQYTGSYYHGATFDPDYIEGEGWFGNAFTLGAGVTINLNTPNAYASGPPTSLSISLAGGSKFALLNTDHHVQVNTAGGIIDSVFSGYKLLRLKTNFSSSAITSAVFPINFSSIDDWNMPQNPGRCILSYISFRYPHTYDFKNEVEQAYTLNIPDNFSGFKTYARFTNLTFPLGGKPLFFDLTNNRMIRSVQKNGSLNVLIPNSGSEKTVYLTSEAAVKLINSLEPVSTNPLGYARFINYQNPAINYECIIITHKSLMAEAINYKNYRNLNKNTLLIDIDELYNQFSYGIAKHPLAIKNFTDFVLHSWPAAPKSLFLLGKSINPISIRNDKDKFALDLVPTYGYPSSDLLLTAGLTTYLFSPSVPIGRLAAQNTLEVSLYLNKVKAYEKQVPAEWMKNVLHLGGGASTDQISSFTNYLNIFKGTIMQPYFGGKVTSFFKTSSAVIQINQSDFLHALIDTGVSIITFFGHANGTGFDQNIDAPSAYNNKDRYPLIIANSCYSGDIHTTKRSTSEDFILIDNKGAIGFIASISEGYSNELFNYTNQLYKDIARESYGQSIGFCIKKTIEKIQIQGYEILKSTCLQMTLHGDPSLVINSPKLPDLLITSSKIFFAPSNVTAQQDSFTVNIIATNIGKVVSDSFQVSLRRTFPEGSQTTYIKKISMQSSFDTIRFRLPVVPQNAIGVNTFDVKLDVQDSIRPEITELNNQASTKLIIQSDEIIPVYPYKYAIIPNDTVTLKASTSNPFAPLKDYIFQFDTTDTFDSPALMQQTILQAKGGVVRWRPTINFKDSLVYFWRVSPDSKTGLYKWRESSFMYKPAKTGWSQAHIFQFKNDTYKGINYKKASRTTEFSAIFGALSVTSVPNNPLVRLNGITQDYDNCSGPGGSNSGSPVIDVIVVDPLSLISWNTRYINRSDPSIIESPDHNFGNFNDNGGGCRNRTQKFFMFSTSTSQLRSLRYMFSKIPTGFYVLVITGVSGNFNTWDDSTFKAFEAMGATRIRTLTTNPYIFFTKKGTVSTTQEIVGDSLNPIISLNTLLTGKLNLGHIESEIIGPATAWSSLHWRQQPKEKPSNDFVRLNIYGLQPNGLDSLLLSNLKPTNADTSIAFIDQKRFPYLRLDALIQDDSLRTTSDLKKWQIYYTPKPEAALNPSRYFSFYKDNIDEGDKFQASVVIENISPYDMDSLLVNFDLYDQYRVLHRLPYKRRRPLPAAGKRLFMDTLTIAFSTVGLTGANSLWIEANPNNDQLEQYHFNNIGQLFFNVNKDRINPLMDVTFDGIHILDGDIVSSKPFILVQLRDENRFLKLDTSSLVKLYLKNPGATDEVLVPFDNTTARFIPAKDGNKNVGKVEFSPKFLNDGRYQLRVQSKDKSSNLSAYMDYKVTFEVVNKSTITEVMNYPNPFSTSTRFVFTLTGSEVPTYFKIQIMTVTGKIIREIMLNELGPLHIGRNITDYVWDGKDEYGDRLANGLYLYHVVTKVNETSIDKRESGADKYFNSGYGKMYLMR